MSSPVEADNFEEPKFNWGKKRGRGGKNKTVQFYESFTYDEMEYTLYDCVYMYVKDKPEPYIGKLIKIWEDAGESKKVKVQWFFRPSEISCHLRDIKVAENELFFATGEGIGLANINPLEAIAGKCNVVCISTDSRNPQPSIQELQMADYVFYRLFDVKNCMILDKMDDKVGGVDVEFVFNRKEGSSSLDGSIKLSKEDNNGIKISKFPGNDSNTLVTDEVSSDANPNSGHEKNAVGPRENLKVAENFSAQEERPSKANVISSRATNSECKTNAVLSDSKPKSEHDKNAVGPEEKAEVAENLSVSSERPSKVNVSSSKETKSIDHQHSLGRGNDSKLIDNSSGLRERPANNGDVSPKMKPISGNDQNSVRTGQPSRLAETSSTSGRMTSKASVFPSKGLSVHDTGHEKNSVGLKRDPKFAVHPRGVDERPSKKVKADNSVTRSEDKNSTIQKLDTSVGSEAKKSSVEDKTKSRPFKEPVKEDKAHSKEVCAEKTKFQSGNLSKPCVMASTSKNSGKVEGQIFEVTRRPPIGKSTWFRELGWEERVPGAHDKGTLVLLQNLDPGYTSGEVEDIVWHAFNENCSAKMIQHTAVSSPYSGQALVIFKTREAAEKVVWELDNGCLMLPNGRPLVGCHAILPRVPGKQVTFPGHLVIDDIRRQTQRDMKDAVSTSHYSQTNTIEFEMAMDWCLLQSRSDRWWKKLYEGQREQLKILRAKLRSK